MKKKMIATLAAALMLSTASVMAAPVSPFADVSPKHWSYEAVTKLAQAGIVDGYGDGTFRGDRTMTRYEMAQIVGKAMYRSDKANAEQKAMIEKLSKEYADELQSMGVKVSNLEKSTAGVKDWKISGTLYSENTYGHNGDAAQSNNHEYVLETRIAFEKQINDKMHFMYQPRTYTQFDREERANADKDRRGTLETRQAWVSYDASKATTLTFGKVILWDGFLYDDYLNGVTINTKVNDNLSFFGAIGNATVYHNQLVTGYFSGKAGHFNWTANYLSGRRMSNSGNLTGTLVGGVVDANHPNADYGTANIYGGSLGYTFDNGLSLTGYYAVDNNAASGLNNKYKKVSMYKKVGQTDVTLRYEAQGAYFNTPIENTIHTAFWGDQYMRGIKGYRAIIGGNIYDNTYLEGFYGNYKTDSDNKTGAKYGFDVTFSF